LVLDIDAVPPFSRLQLTPGFQELLRGLLDSVSQGISSPDEAIGDEVDPVLFGVDDPLIRDEPATQSCGSFSPMYVHGRCDDSPDVGEIQWASSRLNAPILDSLSTPSGLGYWMVASDGGIFSFGDARFFGSTGSTRLNQPMISVAPDPDGAGYWLVASDGGIFAFEAPYYGSMGAVRLNRPISGIVQGAGGYLMVAEDRGVVAFGAVDFHGPLPAMNRPTPQPAAAVALKPPTG
jgi:hypothetical protein